MNNLQIVKSAEFQGVPCDFYQNDGGDVFMTSEQLGQCLGYSNPRESINKVVQRNEYVKELEFSCEVKMTSQSGAKSTRVFNEDGIYEITMLSKTEKAKEFRAFVRKTLKAIRKGEVKVLPTDEYKRLVAEAKLNNSRARVASMWTKLADLVELPKYKQVCASYASNTLAGREVLPLPLSEEKHYTATEIGNLLGVSKQRIGQLANANGLKCDEFGEWYHDKSPYSAKEVDTFRYNEKAIQEFKKILKA